MGSLLRVACAEASLEALHREYPALPVYGAVLDGENIFKAGLDKAKGIIVIGNEGRGLSPEAERFLSHRISIPRAAQSRAESLNAAIAAGILCAVFTNMH